MCCGSEEVRGTFTPVSLGGPPPACCDEIFKCVWGRMVCVLRT